MVVIDEDHAREPDASVQYDSAGDPNSMVLEAPLIVIEVVSPTSERDDTVVKLAEYFSIPSIQHYLIVNPAKDLVIHHRRGQGGKIEMHTATAGDINLTPPGITVPVAELLPKVG
jgi:Uma2 family endonuclease